MKIKTLLLSLFLISLLACNDSKMEIASPNKDNILKIDINEKGELHYSVYSRGELIAGPSVMGVEASDTSLCFNKGLKFKSKSAITIDEKYTLPTGKRSLYENKANEKTFTFVNTSGKEIAVICRAYDDGVAFRYGIDTDKITLTKELTTFDFPSGSTTWMMDWRRDYENFFPERLLDTITNTDFMYPALIKSGNNWLLLTEAAIYNQPATHLIKNKADNTFNFAFAREDKTFTLNESYYSPWRTFMLGNNLQQIVESVLVENLNPESVITNTDWIEPGVAVFPWWGNYMANSYIDTLKTYIDMAAEMKWDWLEFDVSLINTPFRASKEWENVDWIPELTSYARSKGIKVYGWDEIRTLNNKAGRDFVFSKYKEMGIDGIKIDYIDSDSQYAMCFRDTACAVAAEYGLMVSFHGETLPHGHRRKYPNIMTNEGVKGAEYYTFRESKSPNSVHNCTLPFTRNVVGSMDYTPTTFTIRKENPRTTTYAHELALAFVFESGWVCMADRPDAYLNSPAKPILQRVEAAWDETKLIDGYPGEYVVIARRKGDTWYLSGINALKARTVSIPLDFLKNGKYKFDVYTDHEVNPMTDIKIVNYELQNTDVLTVELIPNGGFATVIEQKLN